MNKKTNHIKFGNEIIMPIVGGLYHATIEIDGKLYQNYDRDPMNGLKFIMDIKKRKGSGKFSDVNITDMYGNSDVKITIEDDKCTVLLHILDRDFTIKTYDKMSCLLVLKAIGAKRSQRLVETYRASLARYAWSIIMYGDEL